jgi:hypothetical protein
LFEASASTQISGGAKTLQALSLSLSLSLQIPSQRINSGTNINIGKDEICVNGCEDMEEKVEEFFKGVANSNIGIF